MRRIAAVLALAMGTLLSGCFGSASRADANLSAVSSLVSTPTALHLHMTTDANDARSRGQRMRTAQAADEACTATRASLSDAERLIDALKDLVETLKKRAESAEARAEAAETREASTID